MDDYAPASSLGWLDFDAAASERVAELLRALEESSTLDLLGLGSIWTGFADMLNPGTSTVHTRLRYFLFVPWIVKRLEDERVPPPDFARKKREDEARLIDCLRPLGRNQGVIGYRAGSKLKRMPSDIYWGGLIAWGIRRDVRNPVGLAQHAAAGAAKRRVERDDDGNATTAAVSLWADLPPSPDDFLKADISFALTPREAEFLVERIQQSQPHSLLAALATTPEAGAGVDYPWDIVEPVAAEEQSDKRPLAGVLHHARCFSEISQGPRLVYRLLAARQAGSGLGWDTEKIEADTQERLEQWSQMIADRGDVLRSWVDDSNSFKALMAGRGASSSALDFWGEMARLSVEDPSGFAEKAEIHQLIRARELRLKSRRARLTHQSALESSGIPPLGGQLDYRWSVTKRYLADLAAAKQGS
ncbi:MAG: DUF6361 family protein [Acidimicrobiaceae bacterium]|nr:DUF6361 family protein [Acidimicrobiaceae bacterium]